MQLLALQTSPQGRHAHQRPTGAISALSEAVWLWVVLSTTGTPGCWLPLLLMLTRLPQPHPGERSDLPAQGWWCGLRGAHLAAVLLAHTSATAATSLPILAAN